MTINYNVTGIRRKSMACTIGKWLNTEVKYLGAPSFAYEIGPCRLDLNGALTLKGEDNSETVNALLDHLKDKGFESSRFENGIEENQEDKDSKLNVILPKNTFTNESIENLKSLINSKKGLIKKALGIDDLPIEISDDTISFPWQADIKDPDAVKAYTHFICALCDLAKKQKRALAAEKIPENEKYAFRCFLIRLGFIGNEYKTERKILLKNLLGSSAFKGGCKNEISE